MVIEHVLQLVGVIEDSSEVQLRATQRVSQSEVNLGVGLEGLDDREQVERWAGGGEHRSSVPQVLTVRVDLIQLVVGVHALKNLVHQ